MRYKSLTLTFLCGRIIGKIISERMDTYMVSLWKLIIAIIAFIFLALFLLVVVAAIFAIPAAIVIGIVVAVTASEKKKAKALNNDEATTENAEAEEAAAE